MAAYPGAKVVDDDLAKKTAVTEENLIKKYGEEEGIQRFKEYKEKQAYTNSLEYKAEKNGWTKSQFDEYNQSRACTLENLIERHGEEVGVAKWDDYIERQRYTTTIEYFKEKYGAEGEEKWNEFCRERGKSSSIEFIQKKYNVTKEEAETLLAGRYRNRYTSQMEMDFVDDIQKCVGDIKYTAQTNQFCIWSYELDAPVFYDVVDSDKMKVIEFNGDYWHQNPKKYSADSKISQSGKTAKDVWERDRIKLNEAKKRGFDVMVVWESDYQNNPTQVLDNVVKWWNNEG
jgi:hypothetical protein